MKISKKVTGRKMEIGASLQVRKIDSLKLGKRREELVCSRTVDIWGQFATAGRP